MKPWHKDVFDTVINTQKINKLPHALVIHGHAGIGKLELTQNIIQHLVHADINNDNLEVNDGEDNILIRHSHYKGLIYIQNEIRKNAKKISQVISVNQVRSFCNFLEQTSGNLQIGVIKYADTMHTSASNALLKTLEEPRENTLIILLVHNLKSLPITILSRCQKLHLNADASTLSWLQQHAPTETSELELKQLLQDNNYVPQLVIDKLESGDYNQEQQWKEQLLSMAINPNNINKIEAIEHRELAVINCLGNLVKQSIEAKLYEKDIKNTSHNHILQKTNIKMLFNLMDDINKAKSLCNTSVNKKLLLDNLLIVWSHITHLKDYPKITMET